MVCTLFDTSDARDCSQAWANIVSSGVNYAQQAKMYIASGAEIVVATSSSSTTPAKQTTKTLASTTGSLANPGKAVTSCPAGCVPISYSSTISIIPTSVSTPSSTPAAGCPVAGGSCSSGAMACSGYYYGQCANGVWVMRKCADGLACFETGGSVYCDWASNGVITNCGSSSSKVKRDDNAEYGVAFVGGDSSMTTPEVSSAIEMSSSELTTATGLMNWLWSSSTSAVSDEASSVETEPTATREAVDYTEETETAESDSPLAYTKVYSTTYTSTPYTTTDVPQVSAVPYALNSSSSLNSTSTSNTTSASVISDVTSTGATPPTNVTLSIQPLNTTNFVAVLQATTLNNTPILTDWSFSFNSNYQILGTDRGNLTKEGTDVYTITSIPIQEPDRNMAIIVKLWGVYDSNTAEGLVGYDGVTGGSSGANGSFALFKRAIRWE